MDKYVELLEAEHTKLQQNYAELQKRYELLVVAAGSDEFNNPPKLSFVQKLVAKVAEIYEKDLYSDITIHCDGHQLRGHRMVISTRTDYWDDLSGIDRIEFEDTPYNVGCAILRWIYTDYVDSELSDRYLMDIFEAAIKFRLLDLQQRCELLLRKRVDVANCLRLYEFAVNSNLVNLRENCEKLVQAHWDHFEAADFANMCASLLYHLVKSNSENILQLIIQLKRNDVLFLYFIENSSELPRLCNEEVEGWYPLELALELDQLEMATSFIKHHANVNITDKSGRTLLMRLLMKNKIGALKFLTQNGAKCDQKNEKTGENLLHIAALIECSDELIDWLWSNLDILDVNGADCNSKTVLLRAIEMENLEIVRLLLQKSTIDVNKMERSGRSPIACALFEVKNLALAEMIAKAGADINVLYQGIPLIHHAVYINDLNVVHFLCKHKVDVNGRTVEGLVPLQVAVDAKKFNADLTRILLRAGANISAKILDSSATLLHHIIDKENDKQILEVFVENDRCSEDMLVTMDANGDTLLAKAVFNGKFQSAEILLRAGANINEIDAKGESLLVRVISRKLDDAAVFLLDHGADILENTSGKDCFSLAVEFSLTNTVRRLCGRCEKPTASLLWIALKKGSLKVAEILVESGCDVDGWSYDDDCKCRQTFLHKTIGLRMRDEAIFLINNGCNIDASEQSEIIDDHCNRDTPLLACIRSNFDDIALHLIERGARLDKRDAEGRTAIHVAVHQENIVILNELLSNCNPGLLLETDCNGNTPLDLAISKRNYVAAEALIKKAPNLVIQVDKHGELPLHKAVRAADLEWVLFLISAKSDINAYTQNESHVTALHLSTQCGNEIIMRNLILAGANVNAVAAGGLTPLHVAASNNHEALCMILLENGAHPNIPDQSGNTPLHVAVFRGSVASVNVLVADSQINLRAVNKRQQNPLFLAVGDLSKTNALDILQMFLNADPHFPLDAKDADGFTVFLLAYLKGNENMCHELLRCGVCLGTVSNEGISIFKHSTPTKQLLFSLLDKLEREPAWADGDSCSECEIKFSLTMRKHHCRHCGRLICARCSAQTVPILKYNIEKPVRVCQICCDVLTMGHI